MDTFLDQFNTLDAEVEGRINELSTEIVRLLNLMSLNCRHTEITANITGILIIHVQNLNYIFRPGRVDIFKLIIKSRRKCIGITGLYVLITYCIILNKRSLKWVK